MTEKLSGVRVRMAPGPTGPFHFGRTRAAILNWLFARHHGGTFILRIEDTDQKRSRPEYLTTILESLRWLGLDWDEGPDVGGPFGPYFQMGRLDTYREYADQLIRDDHAYWCYCSTAELDSQRKQAERERRAYRYPKTCRFLSDSDRAQREASGIRPVLRMAVPDGGSTSFHDLIVGHVTVQNSEIDDSIIVKSDGIPTYNFAVVVDDLTMEITHVIRGQDHVPNTPRQVLLYGFLGKQPPTFAHLPLVHGMEGGRLSARHGAEAVTAYGNDGYLPEALLNYVATIGAAYDGEREIFSLPELIEAFDITKIGKSSASFSEEKLEWMNAVHIRTLPLHEFARRALPFLEMHGLVDTPPSQDEVDFAARALCLEQERVKTLAETPDAIAFFFDRDLVYDPVFLVGKKSTVETARAVLEESLNVINGDEPFEHDPLEASFRALADRLDVKPGIAFSTIRVAITGRTATPPLFDTMLVLGRERVRDRLEIALSKVESLK